MADPSDAAYRLVFADEFNGNAVDTNKFVVAGPSWTMPNSLSTATASQVSVSGGNLVLNAVRPTAAATFSSGSVSTYGKYNFSGGYAEARIDLPSTPGSWPAFWGLYNGWPPEVDIMEYPLTTNGGTNGYANNAYHTAYHYGTGTGNASGAGKVTTGTNLATSGYHTFAMDWVANTSVKFFLDGNQVSSYTGSAVNQMVNMYMILDYAVGGWPGTPNVTQWPVGFSDQTKVDWLHVWQKNPNADVASSWAVNGGGAFATAGNWSSAGVPKFGNQTAVFGRVGTAATAAISMPAWSVFGGITFDGLASGTNAGTTAYTLGASTSAVQLASTAAGGPVVQATSVSSVSQNISARVELWNSTTVKNDMTGGQTLSFNSTISGNGALNVSGVGTVVLNAANTYTGGTNVGVAQEAAVLRANADGALGTGNVAIGAAGNATTARLEIAGSHTLANNIDFRGRANTTVGLQSVGGSNTLSGTITANSGGNVFAIQSDSGMFTLTGGASTATVPGVALQAGSGSRVFTLQGAGDGLVSGKVQNGGGTVGIIKAGGGTWTLTGPNTYTGATTLTGGKLVLANAASMASITVGSGATLNPRGSLATSGALTAAGTVDLVDNGIATLTAGSLGLTGATLNFQLGNGTSADRIAASGAATASGTNTINLAVAPGQSITNGSAFTLLTAASGLSAANFALGSKPTSLGFYNFTLSTPTASALLVTASGNPTPTTAYWTGAGSVAAADGTNSWGAGAAVSTSNWSTDAAGANDAVQLPGSITDVVLNAASATGNAGVSTTQLDAAYSVKSLTVDVAAGGITSAVVNTNGNALSLGSGGLTLAASSNASATLSGSGSVQVNGSQTWANNSDTRGLTVAAPVSASNGATTLTVSGTGAGGVTLGGVLSDGTGTLSTVFNQAGTTTLSAINTYTGTTTVAGGIVEISPTGRIAGNATVASGGTLRVTGTANGIGDSSVVNVQAGGTFDVRAAAGVAATETIGMLTGGGTVTRGTSGVSTLTVGSADLSGTFAGSIQNGGGTVALAKAGTGTLTLSGASAYTGGTTVSGGVLNVQNSAALGTAGTVNQAAGGRTSGVQLQGGITLPGTLNFVTSNDGTDAVPYAIANVSGDNRINGAIALTTGGGNSVIQSDSGALTLAGNITVAAGQTSKGVILQGGSTAANAVLGTISDLGAGAVVSVIKNQTGAWTLAANNTYTGGTTVNGGILNVTGSNNFGAGALTVTDGDAILTASNSYTGGTVITGDAVGGENGGSVATGGRVVMAHPTALGTGNVTLSGNSTLEVATDGGDRAYNLNVGTNNTVNLVSGVKTGSAGINHTLGTLAIGINDTVNVTASDNVAGGNAAITLGNITLSSGFGAGSTVFNPTTAALKIGAVATSTNSAKTLVLDGTADGNAVNGAISNGANVVAVVKRNSSTWTLNAAGSYTGGTTINDNGGALRLASGTALGSGALTIGNGGSNASGVLQLINNITVTGVPAINIAGRLLPAVGGSAAIENVSGTNTIATPITFSGAGGNAVNVLSTAGQLTLAGNLTTSTVTGPRGFNFAGDGNGTVSGVISNGSATVFVQKAGVGTWSLTGANAYTGVTTVAAGTLRATNAAYANLLANAGGVDVTGVATKLVLDYAGTTSPVAQVKTLLNAGYASGFASGQIRSSTAAGSVGLGYGDNGSFVTIMTTLYGDSDLDGDVDFNDFLALQTSFGQSDTRFDQGNFNYDGATDFNDFLTLQTNFGQSINGANVSFTTEQIGLMNAFFAAETTTVPEPASLAVVGFGAAGLLRRRRRAGLIQ